MPRRYSRKAAAGRLLQQGIRLKDAEDGGHDHGPATNGDDASLRLGVAASSEARLQGFLAGWSAERRDVRIEDIRCVLPAGHLREVPKP